MDQIHVRYPAGFESGFGFEAVGFGFKKKWVDSDSAGFGFKVAGFGSGFGFEMPGFAHHWSLKALFFLPGGELVSFQK